MGKHFAGISGHQGQQRKFGSGKFYQFSVLFHGMVHQIDFQCIKNEYRLRFSPASMGLPTRTINGRKEYVINRLAILLKSEFEIIGQEKSILLILPRHGSGDPRQQGSTCWRGYLALWQIHNDSLFLVGLNDFETEKREFFSYF